MKIIRLFGFCLGVLGCLSANASSLEIDDKGNALESSLWTKLEIPVCWENPEDFAVEEQAWVKDAVARTWEQESLVRFVGWGACTDTSDGIRILVSDVGPHVKRLGNGLDGYVNGMVLNSTYLNWSPSCQTKRQYCSEVIAVHEFGHALGFAHEQNRDDTDDVCAAEAQGTDGDIYVGAWDLDSVMNYCNPEWNGSGTLSDTDIETVQLFYGQPIEFVESEEIAICSLESSSDDGNVAANTRDGDLATRWSAKGDGEWIQFNFCTPSDVQRAEIAWFKGDQRNSEFSLQYVDASGSVWYNGTNYESSGETTGLETVNYSRDQNVSAIRITGHGNSSNTWNSITEVKLYNQGSEPDYPNLVAPTSAQAEATGTNEITVTWADTNSEEVGYLVEARYGDNDWTNVGLTSANATSYTHANLTDYGLYEYKVTAVSGIIRSDYAAASVELYEPVTVELAAPTNLSVLDHGAGSVTLNWTDNSTGEEGYIIKVKPSSATTFTSTYSFQADSESYTITGLSADDYVFRVYPTLGNQQPVYTEITHTVSDFNVVIINPPRVTASSDDGNVADNVFDGDYGTRWSALGVGESLDILLGGKYLVTDVRIAWYKGDQRQTRFQIEISEDTITWTKVFDGISSGESLSLETTFPQDITARYVRIIGLGNEFSDWNSITEVQIKGAEIN